jgi:hypothetical protein
MAKISSVDRKLRELVNKSNQPDWTSLNSEASGFDGSYMLALNWIHRNVEDSQLEGELVKWLTNNGHEFSSEQLASINRPVLMTMGKVAYCLNRGAQLSVKSMSYITRQLAQVPTVCSKSEPEVDFEHAPMTAAGRLNEDYVNVYSRLDNIRAMVNLGSLGVSDVADRVQEIMERWGSRPGVKARVVSHFKERLEEAQNDSSIRLWIKPLAAIVAALTGVPKNMGRVKNTAMLTVSEPVQKIARSVNKVSKVIDRKSQSKARKLEKTKPAKESKIVKDLGIKRGKISFASQVREMIAQARAKNMSQVDVINLAVSQLGMMPGSARNCVIGNWNRG